MRKILILILLLPIFFIGIKESNAHNDVTPISTSYVEDKLNLFTSTQESDIIKKCQEIYAEYEIHLHVLTAGDIPQNQIVVYSNQYIKNIYGTYDVEAILVVLAHNYGYEETRRHVEISNFGDTGKKLISSNDVDKILGNDNLFNKFKNGKYFEFTTELIYELDKEISSSILFNIILPHAIIGGVALFLMLAITISAIYSRGARVTVSSRTYMENGNGQILGRYDRYLRTTVVRTSRDSGSSGGGGGGGGGRSSGGGRSC